MPSSARGLLGALAVAGSDGGDFGEVPALHGGNHLDGGDPGDAQNAPTEFSHGSSVLSLNDVFGGPDLPQFERDRQGLTGIVLLRLARGHNRIIFSTKNAGSRIF